MQNSLLPPVGILFQQDWSQQSTAPSIATLERYQLTVDIIFYKYTKKAGWQNLKPCQINKKELCLIVFVLRMTAN